MPKVFWSRRERYGGAALLAFALFSTAVATAEVRVVDGAGSPIVGARVAVFLPADPTDPRGAPAPIQGESDSEGRLPFALPRISGGVAVVDAAGFAPRSWPLDANAPVSRLELSPGVAQEGTLVGDGETPAGPAQVCALWRPLPAELGQPFAVRRCALAAATGEWRIDGLPLGEVTVEANLPGYLPLQQRLFVPTAPQRASLDPGKRAWIRVRSEQGVPVAGATVRCDGAVTVTTDARGEAQVALPGAAAECTATESAVGSSAPTAIRAPQVEPQTVRLADHGGIRGSVIGDDGSTPADIHFDLVEAFEGGGGLRTFRVEPELLPEGRFLLRVARPGRFALRIQARGWRAEEIDWLVVGPGQPVDLGAIMLRRGAGVRGTVLDARTSQPIAGALVHVRPAGRARLLLGAGAETRILTDDDGTFVAAGLPVGRFTVEIQSGHLAPAFEDVDLDEEAVVDLFERYLHPFVQVSGRVERTGGEAVAGSRVELVHSLHRDAETVASAITDRDGRFALRVGPGFHRVLVTGSRLLLDQEIDIPAGQSRFELDLRLRRTHLSGLVTERGGPIGGGELVLRPVVDLASSLGVVQVKGRSSGAERWAGRSESPISLPVDVDGTFSAEDAPTGRVRAAYFGLDGRQATRILDVADDREVSLVLDVGGQQIEGAVVDQNSRAGIEATVELVDADAQSIASATCENDGSFVLSGVPPGEYRLAVQARGYRMAEPGASVVIGGVSGVREGEAVVPPPLVELVTSSGASLRVAVQRANGSRAAGTSLVLLDESGQSVRALPADGRGTLGLSELPRGRFTFVWSETLSGTGASEPFDLPSSTRDLDLAIDRGRDLVVRCQGEGCEGARLPWLAIFTGRGIDLAPYLLRSSAIAFSAEGEARVGRLGPGTYRVVAMAGGRRLEKTLEVSSGPGEVELALPRH